MIHVKTIRFDYLQHVMQGKSNMRSQSSLLDLLFLTNNGDTAKKRIDWNFEKIHSNDVICIT